MTGLARELRAVADHLFARIESAAEAPAPAILESIATECEGAARVLRRMAADQRREELPA
ncbi:MAG: hypothetical protein KGZ52_01420 [Xanthomonadaceae bacterium]|nr:hypothetical protein [Xanthomonadaceae bacterium]